MAILWPAFALVGLTMAVVFLLARARFAAARAGLVDPRYYRSFQGGTEPESVAVVSRNLSNLYEMPTLFYAGVAIAFAAGEAGSALVALAWVFVALRLAHTLVHLRWNRLRWRFRVFAASWLVLIAYWALLGFRLVTVAPAA